MEAAVQIGPSRFPEHGSPFLHGDQRKAMPAWSRAGYRIRTGINGSMTLCPSFDGREIRETETQMVSDLRLLSKLISELSPLDAQ